VATLIKTVAKNLKRLREQRGLTQEEAADLCKMEYKQYQRYEGSTLQDMRLSTVEKIAKGVDLKITDFFIE
jgi:transcriptional regulator with XRE-family HTH domain